MRLFWLIVLFGSLATAQEPAGAIPEQNDEPLLVDEDELLAESDPEPVEGSDDDLIAEPVPEAPLPAPVEKPVPTPAVTAPAAVQAEKKAVPGEEEKPPVKFTGYSSSRAHVRFDMVRNPLNPIQPKDDYAVLSNETLVEGAYDVYTLGVRKNLVFFLNRDHHVSLADFYYRYSPEAFNHGWQHYVDRLYFKGDWQFISFTVGDFYESLNRGLLFSMLKDPAREDNSIRGLSTVIRAGDFHAKAFGGMANPYLRDGMVLERMGEADDYLWGVEAGYKALDRFDVGVEYGGGFYNDYTISRDDWSDPSSPSTYVNKYYHVVGAYADLFRLIPQVNAYIGATLVPAGADRMVQEAVWGDTKKRTDLTLANALYFSLLNWYDISKSRLTLTVEGKRYERYWLNYRKMEDVDFKRRYFKLPSLMWDNLSLLNPENTMALRTRVQFTDNDITGLTAAVEFIGGLSEKYRESSNWEEDQVPKEDYWFVAGTLERRVGSVYLTAKSGFLKINQSDHQKYNGETLYTQLLTTFGKSGFSAKLNLELYYRDLTLQTVIEERKAIEQRHVLDLSWKNTVFLSYVGTYYRNKFTTLLYDKNIDEYYPGGSVGYAYKDLRVSLFGGMMRGGLTCLGGVCRYLPDFKGIKLELDVKL